ncbi:hypothetical protein MANES_10G091700v8 [Manihot esculenta]|uniref:NB-ARC domain-containing protein n=1 Tax=Manihot esculenta TaxID=3983 RepID=A0A2C9V5X5_MANES|nr:hypothetical protein MANES_10G091700v8 [Manihot esculenta]
MEEIFLSSVLQMIFDRVASPVLQRLGSIWVLEDNLKKLQQSLFKVQAVLEDAGDQQVTRNFDVIIWVFVSENLHVKMITKDSCKFTEMDLLQAKLWDLLHKKRFLVLFDDVWRADDLDDWDKLRPLFKWDLGGDDCWALFRQRAFQRGQIVRICRGLPLAAKALVPRNFEIFSSFKHLVVLDLNSCGLTELHESVGELFCLKHLDLSYTFIRDLPGTIQCLYSVEALYLHGCSNLEQLPNQLPSANLRHLITTGCEGDAMSEDEENFI